MSLPRNGTRSIRTVADHNRYVEGSGHPITSRDADGNTYQTRRLDDSSTHQVLKNIPTEAELLAAIEDIGKDPVYTALEYYWVFEFTTQAIGA